jgi:hypothetical protein
MGFLDQIGGMLEQYTSSNASVSHEQARQDYDRISQTVPSSVLGSVIGPALASLGAHEVESRVGNSAGEMTPPLRSQFLQRLFGAVEGAGGSASSVLSKLGLDPSLAQQPENASPQDVGRIAAQVHQSHPAAFDSAMEFYSQHPTLVKVLGTVAIAKIAQHLSTRQ